MGIVWIFLPHKWDYKFEKIKNFTDLLPKNLLLQACYCLAGPATPILCLKYSGLSIVEMIASATSS